MKLLLGTAKGLVVYAKNKHVWQVETVHFVGFPVSMVYVDERTRTWWAGLPHRHWGQKLHRSTDEGRTWQQVATPRYPVETENFPSHPQTVQHHGVAQKKETENFPSLRVKLKLIWCMSHAGLDKPTELWLGTEPGGLFHSKDNGDSWQLVESLWHHPSRSKLWFGAGKDDPFIHSIVVDPRDSDHVYIAVSCAGVFETCDGGKTWSPRNVGLKATYLPNPNVEVGHDPHLLLACAANPEVLWQQNHCGIFRSTNGGATWTDVSDKNGIAHYGFALAIDPKNPNRAWVIPAESDEMRVPHDLALCVCRTEDGGQTWQPLREGLPQNHCFDIVFRHSFDNLGETMAFGTTTGNLYVSENGGEAWQCLSHNLARIDSVRFVL